jgi:hypothetical protein
MVVCCCSLGVICRHLPLESKDLMRMMGFVLLSDQSQMDSQVR